MYTTPDNSYTLICAITGMVVGYVVHHLRWLYKATKLDDHVEKELDLLVTHNTRLQGEDDPVHVRICTQLILSLTVRSLTSGLLNTQQEETFKEILYTAIELLKRPVK